MIPRARGGWAALVASAALALAAGAAAAVEPVLVTDGLSQPLFLTAPPGTGGQRLFVVERAGRIRLIEAGVLRATPFLDLSDRVDTEREGGMTGLAFPPDYATTGRFFVYYQNGVPNTDDRIMTSRVSAFQANGEPASAQTANPASEQVIFSLAQPNTIHNGGTIAIRDGWLYLALGDGGGGPPQVEGAYDPDDRAQQDGVPFGKMLRLDLDTPSPDTGDWQVWAKGLRNPFRFSFDRATGDLVLGDVGQDSREEVDFLPAGAPPGANFGWDVLEGTQCVVDPDGGPDPGEPACDAPALVDPIHEYAHFGFCSAVTGGFVYRGSRVPALAGQYLFADYCNDRIWSLRRVGQAWELQDRTAELLPETPFGIAGFGEDADGELYLMGLNSPRLYRVPEPAGGAGAALLALAGLAVARAAPRR